MSTPINFNNMQKRYLSVTLADEKNTTLLIGTPTKAIMDDLISLQNSINTYSENETNVDAFDAIYGACARVMSRNKAGVKITKEQLEEILDYEDILIFFSAYLNFVSELKNQKN